MLKEHSLEKQPHIDTSGINKLIGTEGKKHKILNSPYRRQWSRWLRNGSCTNFQTDKYQTISENKNLRAFQLICIKAIT